MNEKLLEQGRKAREAARFLSTASTSLKRSLDRTARALKKVVINLAANAVDMENGKAGLAQLSWIACC